MLASRIGPRQKNWLEATQKRINYTTEILGAMRNVKMLGLAKQMEHNIQNMREKEITVSRRYRRLHALNITLGKAQLSQGLESYANTRLKSTCQPFSLVYLFSRRMQ